MQVRAESLLAEKSGWMTDETKSALHYDELSRLYAFTRMPHLSTVYSKLFRNVLSGNQHHHNSSSSIERRGRIFDLDNVHDLPKPSSKEEGLGSLPLWIQYHNRRCPICNNALFLGINCTTININSTSTSTREEKNGQVQCTTCNAVIQREEPNKEIKRTYRSLRTRQNKRVDIMNNGIVSDPSEKKEKVSIRDELDVVKGEKQQVRPPLQSETMSKEPIQAITPLQQRANEIKRQRKGKKKAVDSKIQQIDDEVIQVQASNTALASEIASGHEDAKIVTVKSKRKQPISFAKQDESILRQMLAQKRAKQQEKIDSSQGKGVNGGLQDFLSTL